MGMIVAKNDDEITFRGFQQIRGRAALTRPGGRLTLTPPTLGARSAWFVPEPDGDGLDVAGIHAGFVTGVDAAKELGRGFIE
jgi:hypothetical protein